MDEGVKRVNEVLSTHFLSLLGTLGAIQIIKHKSSTVYMGMKLIRENKTSSIIIIGDLELIIKGLRKLSKCSHSKFRRICQD
jgi:hypothetical protein